MSDILIGFFAEHVQIAALVSIIINVVVSIMGVVPSFFLTTANITVFGFWGGATMSFIGEAFGAYCSFWLYRKGFKKLTETKIREFPQVEKLVMLEGKEAFILILSLRLLPFVPSGLVTFFAAIGKVAGATFLVASTLGKFPALLIEAYSVYQVSRWTVEGKVILALFASYLLYYLVKKRH